MSDINKSLELVVKVLVAAIGGILGLFVLGWVMRGLGGLFLGIAGLLIALLKFIVPVAVIAGIVYFAVSQLRPKAPESNESWRSNGSNTMTATWMLRSNTISSSQWFTRKSRAPSRRASPHHL